MCSIILSLLLFLVLGGSACEDRRPSAVSASNRILAPQILPRDFRNIIAEKAPSFSFFSESILFNTSMTNHWGGMVPKAAILADYPSTAKGRPPIINLVASLGSAFEERLPVSIRQELAKRDLLNKRAVDIVWIVQANEGLGEEVDHLGVPATTRIMIHGWADQEAPKDYRGTRVNRNFDLGIFDSERNIETVELLFGRMVQCPVSTHDNAFSPRTPRNQVKIGANDPGQSFWSLAIDSNNPESDIRALANFHWILTPKEARIFEKISAQDNKISFGDLLQHLEDAAIFGERLKRLNYLFN